MKHIIGFVSNSMNNFLDQKPNLNPSLEESMIELLKYQSYNPNLAAVLGEPASFEEVAEMRLHEVCLDLEGKVYQGEEGRRLHVIAYKIMGACVRSRLETDIDQLMFTSDDEALTEATERMYKAESIHIWDHFNEITRELRVISYANREHMNSHI